MKTAKIFPPRLCRSTSGKVKKRAVHTDGAHLQNKSLFFRMMPVTTMITAATTRGIHQN